MSSRSSWCATAVATTPRRSPGGCATTCRCSSSRSRPSRRRCASGSRGRDVPAGLPRRRRGRAERRGPAHDRRGLRRTRARGPTPASLRHQPVVGTRVPVRRGPDAYPVGDGPAVGRGGVRPVLGGSGTLGEYPDVVAEDLWVARHFAPHEFTIVGGPPVTVLAPRRTRDLVRVLRRGTRGVRASPTPIRTPGRRRCARCASSRATRRMVRVRRSMPRCMRASPRRPE